MINVSSEKQLNNLITLNESVLYEESSIEEAQVIVDHLKYDTYSVTFIFYSRLKMKLMKKIKK